MGFTQFSTQAVKQDNVRMKETKLKWKTSARVLRAKPILDLNLKLTPRKTIAVVAIVVENEKMRRIEASLNGSIVRVAEASRSAIRVYLL